MHPALAAILAVSIPAAAGIVVQQQQSQKPADPPSEHARPPLAPQPRGTDGPPAAPPAPYYPGAAPLTEEALERALLKHLIPVLDQIGQLQTDITSMKKEMIANFAKVDDRHNAHVKAVNERFTEMEKAHRARIDELSAQVLALAAKLDSAGAPSGRAAPPSAEAEKALKAVKEKLNKQKKEIAALRKELAEVREAQQQAKPHVTLKPELPQLPRLLPTGTRTFTSTGREYVLVAFAGPCGKEAFASLPLQRPGAERVWAPEVCPNCNRAFSGRVVALAPLNVEVIAK